MASQVLFFLFDQGGRFAMLALEPRLEGHPSRSESEAGRGTRSCRAVRATDGRRWPGESQRAQVPRVFRDSFRLKG